MQRQVAAYLDEVRNHLYLDPRTERRVISELSTHFDEKVEDLRDQGLSEDEAAHSALASFGDARNIARLLYEAHSRGSWTDALIGCQPHLIVAALFATHVWRMPLLLGSAFAAIVVIALLAWRNGGVAWVYSWMGYAALPLLLLAGYLSLDPLSRAVAFVFSGQGAPPPLWHVGLLGALDLFILWLVAATAIAVARRDWLLLSLMLLPIPVVGLWLVTVLPSAGILGEVVRGFEARFSRWDASMGYLFVLLGATTALFVRLRQRSLKVLAVIVVGIVGGALAARTLWGGLGLFRTLAVALCLFLFLTVPLLLRTVLGHGAHKDPLPSA
ncbi:MAG TPA: permease prefix domain 1-containing protein [Spirochaetia bacterium]|nr:permease prefix domain 1-containing protein [Spirochaetia bacterium]